MQLFSAIPRTAHARSIEDPSLVFGCVISPWNAAELCWMLFGGCGGGGIG